MHSTLPVQQEYPGQLPAPADGRSVDGGDGGGGGRQGRLAALDGLRLLAALMVVAYHYIAFDSGAWSAPARTLFPTAHLPASYGWLGVQLFFLISGFVICMSCWGKSAGDFALARVARLYPAYWFAVLTVALVVRLWPSVNDAPALRSVAVNLTMLQDPLGVAPVDGVYWTLWVELRFYLLFALVVHRGLTYRRAVGFCVAWAFAAVLAEASGNAALRQILMPDDCWYFIAGIAFYLMHRFRPNPVLWLLVGGSLFIAQYDLIAAQARAEGHMGHQVPQWPTAVLVTLFFLAVMAIALGWTARANWRWLPVAGTLTYPLYLLHERIGWVVIKCADGRVPPRVLLPLLVAAMMLAAWLVHRCVERPLSRRIKDGMRQAVREIRNG
ncbi:acyltransferase family protein [Streptomyces griseocarneus]|uniref:acyltransferase family protein n=1 Tax=Streptomyces griseocarneus TaxID=51201 RepID=UPI00198FACFB|nr:acyltransferase [Streptomyces griseocarneus]MBZ6473728.1 acyltransferase [Streptomyces griseocarneus]GHG64776.1 acyltransferase [Streptomyces griseocarneus]